MEITTDINRVNQILTEYQGDKAKVWLFDISHIRLAIKIYSKRKDEVLFLLIIGCKYIKRTFMLDNPKLSVKKDFDTEASEVIFKIIDDIRDFELISTGGVALDKGIELEFGDSFEGFLLEK